MIESWRGLAAGLERHRTWTDAQRSLALDLLGVRPELRDAGTPVDPIAGDVLEVRRGVIASEVARLEALVAGPLSDLDADDRAMAESSLGAELTKPLQLLHRYEMAAYRRQQSAWRQLDAARAGRSPAPAPKPSAPRAPAPAVAIPSAPADRAGPRAAADVPARPGRGVEPAVAPTQPAPAAGPGRRGAPGRPLTRAPLAASNPPRPAGPSPSRSMQYPHESGGPSRSPGGPDNSLSGQAQPQEFIALGLRLHLSSLRATRTTSGPGHPSGGPPHRSNGVQRPTDDRTRAVFL